MHFRNWYGNLKLSAEEMSSFTRRATQHVPNSILCKLPATRRMCRRVMPVLLEMSGDCDIRVVLTAICVKLQVGRRYDFLRGFL